MERYKIQKDDKRLIWKIFIPVLLENLVNTFFAIIDTGMLGHVSNADQAIAAVGINNANVNFMVCVITNFCIGATVIISHALGAGNMEKCRKTAIQMFPIMILIGAFATAVLSSCAPIILTLLGANADIKTDAISYLRIIGYGLFFQTITIYITAAFRGIGQTKIPMVYNMGAGVIKIFLNYCLISGHLGFPALRVVGAAWSTTISKAIICIVALLLYFRLDTPIRPYKDEIFRPGKSSVKEVSISGLYSAAEQVFLQSGDIITTGLISIIATTPYAAYQVAGSAQSVLWAITGAFGVTAVSVSGMAKGEGNLQKAQSVTNFIWRNALIVAFVSCVACLFFGTGFASFYTDKVEVYTLAGKLLKMLSVSFFAVATHHTLSGGMRGVDYPKYPLISSIISLWVCRVVGCIILIRVLGLGIEWVVGCLIADQTVRGIGNFIFYNKKVLKPNRLSLKK